MVLLNTQHDRAALIPTTRTATSEVIWNKIQNIWNEPAVLQFNVCVCVNILLRTRFYSIKNTIFNFLIESLPVCFQFLCLTVLFLTLYTLHNYILYYR